jgi:hypothetical protein
MPGPSLSGMPTKGMCTNDWATKNRLGCGDGHADFDITGHDNVFGRALFHSVATHGHLASSLIMFSHLVCLICWYASHSEFWSAYICMLM